MEAFRLTLHPFGDEAVADENGPLVFDNLMAAIHCARAVRDQAVETIRNTDIGDPATFAAAYYTRVCDNGRGYGNIDSAGDFHYSVHNINRKAV